MNATITSTLRTADARRGVCYLRIEEGRYVFEGPSGRHSLDVLATDGERLDAHWTGFVENNGGEPSLHEWAEVANDRELVEEAVSVSWFSYRDNGTPGPETNAHLQIEGADRTLCGRYFPDDATIEDGGGQPFCRACQRVQAAAERRIDAFEAKR